MTTITFEEELNEIDKRNFRNLLDFVAYLKKQGYFPVELKKLEKNKITPHLKSKMEETQKLPQEKFIDIR